ncbi:MAG: type II toxin-antitoxin system HicB family antitoxin [Planctomycetaceae bacterium]
MLVYNAAYFVDDDGVHVETLDFPGVNSCGKDIDEARGMIQSALLDMAEHHLDTGKALPLPDPTATNPDADLEEPVYLLLKTASEVEVVPKEATA